MEGTGEPKVDSNASFKQTFERIPDYGTFEFSRVSSKKPAEQSENVYENKGSVRKSTTPDPSLSKEGNHRATLLGRGGVGGGATL